MNKISQFSVAAATAAKKLGRNQCRRITRVLAQGRAVSSCSSRPRPSENFVQESNIILGSHTFSEFHSTPELYGTRCPPYVRRTRQDFILNRLEILVISFWTNVYNTQICYTKIRSLNFYYAFFATCFYKIIDTSSNNMCRYFCKIVLNH